MRIQMVTSNPKQNRIINSGGEKENPPNPISHPKATFLWLSGEAWLLDGVENLGSPDCLTLMQRIL